MNIKQKTNGMYAKTKYSEIHKQDFAGTSPTNRADLASMFLLRNGYALMQGYAINEVLKLIRSLRELGVEYTMKTIESPTESVSNDKKWRDMYYEFTTVFLDDDRK